MNKKLAGVLGCLMLGLVVATTPVEATSLGAGLGAGSSIGVGRALGGLESGLGGGLGGGLEAGLGGLGKVPAATISAGASTDSDVANPGGLSLAIVGAVGDTGTGGFISMISGLLSGY